MRKHYVLAMILVAVIGGSGCQKSPDKSVVKSKNMDKLIEEAQKDDENSEKLEEMKKYETYQTKIQDDSLHVTVNVNAKVDIPQTDKLSVMRVKQTPIKQEFLDVVREKLIGKETLYDGNITSRMTKKDIEGEIQAIKREMESLEESGGEFQRRIDDLEKKYKKAPKDLNVKRDGIVSEGKIKSAKEMLKKNPEDDFYTWHYSLNQTGDVFYGITDGEDGKFKSLYVQNNEDLGNCLRFYSGRHGYEFVAAANTNGIRFGTDLYGNTLEKAGNGVASERESLQEFQDEKATISKEEAKAIAENFLKEIGLTDFVYAEGGLYNELADIRQPVKGLENRGYRKVYVLRYMRMVDGTAVIYASESKHTEGWQGKDFSKKDWPTECVEFRINDDGIAGFSYNTPIEIMDTVVEKASLKSFEEIKDIFETMVVVTNAEENMTTVLDVNRVVLGYSRISEQDSFDTGLLVPVWEFQNIKEDGTSETILTINAIDGSVIDRTLGY